MKLPNNAPIEAKLISREKVQWSVYNSDVSKALNCDGIIALVETDGELAVIKGIAWRVPEMAVLPLNSIVSFELYQGLVNSMELVKAPPRASEAFQDIT